MGSDDANTGASLPFIDLDHDGRIDAGDSFSFRTAPGNSYAVRVALDGAELSSNSVTA